MQQLKIGVIGVGNFGQIHVQVLNSLEYVKVVAVCDVNERLAQQVAEKYHIGKWYADHRELTQDGDVDAVTIATSEHMHREPTIAAAANGKHMLIEKPLATSLGDADEMTDAVDESGVICMVGHVLKFDSRCAVVKRRIEEGELGKIEAMYARRNVCREMAEHYMKKTSPILDAGIHDIDLMLWYTGDRVERVYVEAENSQSLPYPNIMAALLRFRSGAVGIVENFCNLPNRIPFPVVDARMEVIGSSGAAYLDFSNHSLSFCGEKGWENPDTLYWPDLHGHKIGCLKEEMAYFARCVLHKTKPELNTIREARSSLEVALAGVKSSEIGKPVSLPLK